MSKYINFFLSRLFNEVSFCNFEFCDFELCLTPCLKDISCVAGGMAEGGASAHRPLPYPRKTNKKESV